MFRHITDVSGEEMTPTSHRFDERLSSWVPDGYAQAVMKKEALPWFLATAGTNEEIDDLRKQRHHTSPMFRGKK
jgi:hypothetical protein